MGSVKIDIYDGDWEWHHVNLSSVSSIKGLIKYRTKFDALYNHKLYPPSSLFESNCDLNELSEEVLCLYIWLDDMISRTNLNDKQKEILNYYMQGYTERDIAEVINISHQNINGILKSICKRIFDTVNKSWVNDFVLWSKRKVDTNYKQCSKCKEWLPATTEYFSPHSKGKHKLHPYCKKCR